MTALRFDAVTAAGLLEALRIYEGRLFAEGKGKRLSPGVLELREAAARSLLELRESVSWSGVDTAGQLSADVVAAPDDASVLAPELLTVEDVAGRLHVSVKTVRRRIADKRLRAVRDGGRVLVDPRDYLAYVEANKESA